MTVLACTILLIIDVLSFLIPVSYQMFLILIVYTFASIPVLTTTIQYATVRNKYIKYVTKMEADL